MHFLTAPTDQHRRAKLAYFNSVRAHLFDLFASLSINSAIPFSFFIYIILCSNG